VKVLLADDDRAVRRVFQYKLEKQGHDVTTADDGRQALEQLHGGRFDIVVSDIRMPEVDGIELLEQVRQTHPDLKVILITAHATVQQAVQAVKLGAFDYITKPFEDEELFAVIDRAARFSQLEQENRQLRGKLEARDSTPLIGVSAAFREMLDVVDRIAATDATVLLTGGSGTGKERIARTIHARSHRAGREFIAVNCGAIPRELVESELFGHVHGAFTGATRDKKGKFELADGGTLLLDEVGELAVDLQVKLLRALQERVVEPVGAEAIREVDVRVIAATNVDLQELVALRRFREDLYYRLNVIPIRVPSLSERREDIPLLARAFVERSATQAGAKHVTVARTLMERLLEHDWPGNVRELENLIQRMVLLRRSDTLTLADLPDDFGHTLRSADSGVPTLSLGEAEQRLICTALERAGWNRTRAARNLNIPRHVLIYRMKKYGITPPDK
jgi:two-component system NtrC family response regulator